jgi:hypothetical protein
MRRWWIRVDSGKPSKKSTDMDLPLTTVEEEVGVIGRSVTDAQKHRDEISGDGVT